MVKNTSASSDSRNFYLHASLFAVATLADICNTLNGVSLGLEEGNPITKAYMDYFGPERGLLTLKGLVSSSVLLVSGYAYLTQYARKNVLLDVGSVAQSLAALAWRFL